jgi:hypothetical protein
LIPFLTRNQIKGKVLAGWEISAFLLFYVPDFKVFMDVRDQSYYPPQIIRDYLRIMGVIPEHEETRRNLIERYGVSTIVMSTGPYDFDLSQDLLKTRRWSCIYSDNYSVVLIRSDSVEFADMLRRASFEGLWYPDRATKARSEALQSLFAFGTIRPEVMNELRSIVLSQPSPTLYGYIVAGTNPRGARLDQATVHYLVSEAERLSKISPAHRHGAEEVTGSLIAILGMLEANAYSCGQTDQYQKFALRKEALIRHRIELERYYSGHLF